MFKWGHFFNPSEFNYRVRIQKHRFRDGQNLPKNSVQKYSKKDLNMCKPYYEVFKSEAHRPRALIYAPMTEKGNGILAEYGKLTSSGNYT